MRYYCLFLQPGLFSRVIVTIMLRHLFLLICILLTTVVSAQAVLPDIKAIVERNRETLGVSPADLAEYSISSAYTTSHLHITHAYLQQNHRGIKVFNGILNLNLRGDQIVSFGNRWIRDITSTEVSNMPTIPAANAVVRSADHLGHTLSNAVELSREQNSLGQDIKFVFAPGNVSRADIKAELVWLKGEQEEIMLCWTVEIEEIENENIWLLFIDAHTGAYIRKDNLVLHCDFDHAENEAPHHPHDAASVSPPLNILPSAPDSSYNVFAMPVGSPNHGTRSIEERPWLDAGAGDPATTLGWHKTGTTNYTITRGNNVHAYEDMDNNNAAGYSPDTANLRFDYPFAPSPEPTDNLSSCITNLFYWNNIMHDVMYQYGFDEVSGNFQSNNLGRGGFGNDFVKAEALDGGGSNNANFSTPVDGGSGRMQMYVWSLVSESSPLTINTPPSIAGEMFAVESAFSTANRLEDIGLTTGDLVLVEDATGGTHEACGTISNGASLAGNIAVIDRGNCNFTVKVKNAQNYGAIAAIVINNVTGDPFGMGGSDNSIVIPAVMISLEDGNLLKAVLDTADVNVSLDSVGGIVPDGDFDSGIIAHEYGHGISIRLTGGPATASCLNNQEQMGEGWSDYFGLMVTTDWATASPEDRRGIGTYVIGQSNEGTGIRTYPYSTDTLENPFTYADVANAPLSGGIPSVHFIGSIWCTMLWDMTWNIIEMEGIDTNMYDGDGGNNIALQLVMDGLKLQPCSPGFVDGRDAILLADELNYGGRHYCAIWDAFAGRGLGVGANQGSSNDEDDGIVSFAVPDGVRIKNSTNDLVATEGQEVTITVKATCECENLSDVEVKDVLSEDLIYVPGSGGIMSGDTVLFSADTMEVMDSLLFTYHAIVKPCTAIETDTLSSDNAEGPDQYHSVKLSGSGTKEWVKNTLQAVSPTRSWYAIDYATASDYVLLLNNDVFLAGGPIEIKFYHRYQTQQNFDGGVVEYSFNGGATWSDAGPHFTVNGYPGTISSLSGTVLAGHRAFSGNSDLQFDTMGFIQSTILLTPGASDSLLLRFRFVTNATTSGPGINGWYVDDIVIRQNSGLTNQTRVTINGAFEDSTYYSLETSIFNGDKLYVDKSAAGQLDGNSWADATHELSVALDLAGCRNVDSVFVAQGTYLPNLNSDRQVSFSLPDSTSVYGGFPSGGSLFAQRNPISHLTRLSGDLGTINNIADNAYHVVKIDSAAQDVLLDGVTISHGNANGTGDNREGAAVFCLGDLTMQNVIINNNTGLSNGQLIRIRNAAAHLHLTDCTLYGPADAFVKVLNTNSGQVTISGTTKMLKE
jgi:extracellular elastinolytic metalloproteinase